MSIFLQKFKNLKNLLVVIIVLASIICIVVFAAKLLSDSSGTVTVELNEGVVTQISEDCGDMEQLVGNRVYLIVNGSRCDAGSSFVIDNSIEIKTSSGMVPKNIWSKDLKTISAGDKVRVTYQKYTTKENTFYYSLNCEQCKVEVIQKRPAGIIVEEIDRDRYWEMQDNNLLPK